METSYTEASNQVPLSKANVSKWEIFPKSRILKIHKIKPENSPQVFVAVNGSKRADFASGDIALRVCEGDYIEVDATGTGFITEFVVHVPGGGFVNPTDGLIFINKGSVIAIGRVKFKS